MGGAWGEGGWGALGGGSHDDVGVNGVIGGHGGGVAYLEVWPKMGAWPTDGGVVYDGV